MKWIIKDTEGNEQVFETEANARWAFGFARPYGARLYVEFGNGSICKRYEVA